MEDIGEKGEFKRGKEFKKSFQFDWVKL